jgi:peptidase E
MLKANIISPRSEMLLTSGGVTTDAMRKRLLEMRRLASKSSDINVLRIADGWQPFSPNDSIGKPTRIQHYVESQAARLWSSRYLHWALGKRATIETAAFNQKNPEEVKALLEWADLLVAPGANTYQFIRGIKPFVGLIREAVAEGLPYLGDSAGSIGAGKTITPASLAPVDPCPSAELLHAPGMGFVDADIVVHAKGSRGSFDIHGPLARVTKLALASFASDSNSYKPQDSSTIVYVLNDRQAMSIEAGRVEII